MEAAGEGEDGEGEVGIDGVDGEETDDGGLRGVVDEPARGGQSFVFSTIFPGAIS